MAEDNYTYIANSNTSITLQDASNVYLKADIVSAVEKTAIAGIHTNNYLKVNVRDDKRFIDGKSVIERIKTFLQGELNTLILTTTNISSTARDSNDIIDKAFTYKGYNEVAFINYDSINSRYEIFFKKPDEAYNKATQDKEDISNLYSAIAEMYESSSEVASS